MLNILFPQIFFHNHLKYMFFVTLYKSVTFDQFDVQKYIFPEFRYSKKTYWPHVHQNHIFFEIQYHCTGTIICICKILKAE